MLGLQRRQLRWPTETIVITVTMTEIRITSSISRINGVPLAFQFEETALPYFRAIEGLTTGRAQPEVLRRIYVMFVFDPSVPNGKHGISFDRYSRSKKEAEVTIDIERGEFARLDRNGRLRLVATRLVQGLHVMKSQLSGATADLEALIRVVEGYHMSGIPGYRPVDANGASLGGSAPPAESAGLEGEDPVRAEAAEFQLIIQCEERLFQEEDKLQEVEGEMSDVLQGSATVDGHDVGCGKLDVFITCSDPGSSCSRILSVLRRHGLASSARIAYSRLGDDDYRVLWPVGSTHPFEL
jgi:hypothetical protein